MCNYLATFPMQRCLLFCICKHACTCTEHPCTTSHLVRPYTALGMRVCSLSQASSSLGSPVPVTSFPIVTQ